MARTPITPLRLTLGDRAALDAIAADMKVDRTTAIRKLIYEETRRRRLEGHAAAAFVAGLIETYHANAAVVVVSDGGDARVTISGSEPPEVRAVLIEDELLIEDPAGLGSLSLVKMPFQEGREWRWDGTLADLAAVAAERTE